MSPFLKPAVLIWPLGGAIIAVIISSRRAYSINTRESIGASYTLAKLAFVATLGFILLLKLSLGISGIAPFLILELTALLCFGLLVRTIRARRDSLSLTRRGAAYEKLLYQRRTK